MSNKQHDSETIEVNMVSKIHVFSKWGGGRGLYHVRIRIFEKCVTLEILNI